MNPDSVFDVRAHAVARRVGDELIILDLPGGRYLSLNAVGMRIWELVEEEKDVAAIVSALHAEYDAPPETLERDVAGILSELIDNDLIAERRD